MRGGSVKLYLGRDGLYVERQKIDLLTVEGGVSGAHACLGGYHQLPPTENAFTQKIADGIKQYQAGAAAGTGVKQ